MERKPEKWIIKDERGRRPGQKYKSLLVMQYILKNADYSRSSQLKNTRRFRM